MEKIKQFVESDRGKDILTVIIVLLVGVCSFELGRLSKESTSSGITVESNGDPSTPVVEQTANTISSTNNAPIKLLKADDATNAVGQNFFASRRGKKYYPLGCSAGKTIKESNRVYFDTRDQAVKAGYTPSTSCN